MNVLIFGAGAIGCFLGAHLSEAGHNVTLVARPPLVKLISEHGLTLVEPTGRRGQTRQFTTRPNAVTTLADAMQPPARYGLIILGMKSYDLQRAADELHAYGDQVPTVLALQNGIGAEEALIRAFGSRRVVAGSVTTPVAYGSGGTIVVTADRGLALAPVFPGWSIHDWVTLFSQAGITTAALTNYNAMKWSKAFLNIIANATSAILNWEPTAVYAHNELYDLEMAMLRETLAVMRAQNIPVVDLPGAPATQLAQAMQFMPRLLLKPLLARRVAEGRGGKMPSFHIDLWEGKGKSEVVFYNGAIARAGWDHGVPTPVNTTLTELMLRLTRGDIPRDLYADRPERLLMAVARRRELADRRGQTEARP